MKQRGYNPERAKPSLTWWSESKGLAPLVIIILIALAVGGYLLYQKQLKPAAAPQSSPALVSSGETTKNSNGSIQVCGDYPDKTFPNYERLQIRSGPKWAPDCKHIAWGMWESGTGCPDCPQATLSDKEGVFLYNALDKNVINIYKPGKVGETPQFLSWIDNENLVFGANQKKFKYNLTTKNSLELNDQNNETANWKTYRESSYVFQYPNEGYQVQKDNELSYSKRYNIVIPKDFTKFLSYPPPQMVEAVRLFQTTPEGVTSADKTVFSLWIFDNENDISIDTWYSKYWYYPFNWGKAITSEVERRKPKLQTTVGNKIAQLSVNDDLGKVQYIYVNKDRKIFLFWVKGDLNESSIGNKILSTFKFTL